MKKRSTNVTKKALIIRKHFIARKVPATKNLHIRNPHTIKNLHIRNPPAIKNRSTTMIRNSIAKARISQNNGCERSTRQKLRVLFFLFFPEDPCASDRIDGTDHFFDLLPFRLQERRKRQLLPKSLIWLIPHETRTVRSNFKEDL